MKKCLIIIIIIIIIGGEGNVKVWFIIRSSSSLLSWPTARISTSLLGRIVPSDHTGSMCVSSTTTECMGGEICGMVAVRKINLRWFGYLLRVANHYLEHKISSNINSADSWLSIYGAWQIFQQDHHQHPTRLPICKVLLEILVLFLLFLMRESFPCLSMRSWCLHP